jgi:predicted dehydrogenase
MGDTRKLKWGIISTANIGLTKVIPGLFRSPSSEVVAIASRDLSRAREAADKLGIPRAYGSYEELLADPDIDAVYNPLPNHLHVPMTLAAARAGKHVLCEKPVAMSADEAAQLRQVPGDRLVYEAFMVRFHPQWLRAREIVRSGELGEVRAIRTVFCYRNLDPANVRNIAEIGGGALMDIGCYAIISGRFLFDAEPIRVVTLLDRDPAFGTDRLTSVIADFGNGRQLVFTCSTQLVPQQRVEALGTHGRLELIIPFNPVANTATALTVDTGHTFDGTLARREVFPPSDHYAEQGEAFARAVLDGKGLEWGIDDAIANMKVIDAVFRSEKSGTWETV